MLIDSNLIGNAKTAAEKYSAEQENEINLDSDEISKLIVGMDLEEYGEPWDGETVEAVELKNENWYIYNAGQLKFLADVVNNGGVLNDNQKALVQAKGYDPESLTITSNTTVYLMENIDLGARKEGDTWDTAANRDVQWTPIGKPNYFCGTFEGNNHVIKGMYVSETSNFAGLFGVSSGTIQNLAIKDSYVTSTAADTGGLCGAVTGGVINCHNIDTNIYAKNQMVGGIVGEFVGNSIIGCSNTGNIEVYNSGSKFSGNPRAGGITGAAIYGQNIINCTNYGTISGCALEVGGISGGLKGKAENCINYGSIIGDTTSLGFYDVGGIVGKDFGVTFTECENFGTFSGKITTSGDIFRNKIKYF